MSKYQLIEEVVFEDGNSVPKGMMLKKIEEDAESNMLKLETVSDDNVKKIFWADKKNLKKIN